MTLSCLRKRMVPSFPMGSPSKASKTSLAFTVEGIQHDPTLFQHDPLDKFYILHGLQHLCCCGGWRHPIDEDPFLPGDSRAMGFKPSASDARAEKSDPHLVILEFSEMRTDK